MYFSFSFSLFLSSLLFSGFYFVYSISQILFISFSLSVLITLFSHHSPSYPILSCHILSYSTQIPSYPVLYRPIPSYPTLSCHILSYPILSYSVQRYPMLSSSTLAPISSSHSFPTRFSKQKIPVHSPISFHSPSLNKPTFIACTFNKIETVLMVAIIAAVADCQRHSLQYKKYHRV